MFEHLPTDEVLIGDLEDLETLAKRARLRPVDDAFRMAVRRPRGWASPFHRIGMPMFDRLGAGHQLSVGYRGTRDLIFNIANLVMKDHEDNHEPTPDTWRPGAEPHGAGQGGGHGTGTTSATTHH